MSNPEPPAARHAGKTFDPAAAGWEPYHDEGFIGLVGPFWTRPRATPISTPSRRSPSTTTAAASCRAAC